MHARGFTIIELIITVAILGILMVLAVVNITASQVKSRDDERRADIEAIGLSLESYYTLGVEGATEYGRYPDTSVTDSETDIQTAFPNANLDSFKAPAVTAATSTFVPAVNADEKVDGVSPQPTTDEYVYQPLSAAGTLCTSSATECVKYNLFYQLEGDATVYRYESKNQ